MKRIVSVFLLLLLCLSTLACSASVVSTIAAPVSAVWFTGQQIEKEGSALSSPQKNGTDITSADMLRIGDYITFGSYEQDAVYNNGEEDVEWRVLNKTGSQVLLISRKVLDCKPFQNVYSSVRWNSSDIRSWLNSSFFDVAFSSDEKSYIVSKTITDEANLKTGIPAGNSTQDHVFLLSISEAEKYFDSNGDRLAEATDYALLQGAVPNKGYVWWWLRTPGDGTDHAAAVSHVGGMFRSGDRVSRTDFGVRPCIWIDFSKSSSQNNGSGNSSTQSQAAETNLPSKNGSLIRSVNELRVGDFITFGSYEQDANFNNGQEAIEWRVLEKKGTQVLLISQKVLDSKPYHNFYSKVRWNSSDMRSWLNRDFYNSAFTAEEKNYLVQKVITDEPNRKTGVPAGNATQDYVFLLSISEAEQYFDSNGDRLAEATDYAILQGAVPNSGYVWWWLRTPGVDTDHSAAVSHVGGMYRSGDRVSRNDWGVRPCIWINLP